MLRKVRPSRLRLPRFRTAGLKGRRMLLVHSYHQGYRWVDTITEGVRSAIQGTGLELDIFCMDAKRHTDEAWKIDAGRRARKRVDEFRPDIILAADDDAQEYFATSYLNTALPVVFTGVDADPSKYGYPAANVTGVIERPHFKESLAFAQQLRPIKRIAVLSCHDSTSILALGFMKQEQLDVEVAEWLMVDDFDDWKKAVERFNRSVDAIVIRSYQAVKKPGSSENVPPRDVAAWTCRARHRSDDRLSRLRDRRRPAGGGRQVGAGVWPHTGGVRPPHPGGNAAQFAAHHQAAARHQDDQPQHRAPLGDLLRTRCRRRDSRFQGLSGSALRQVLHRI